ncbi:glycerophosphoryl diester phosphodiesterase [Sesbania bispinosa]|nr:glycerophosphoryl diester phosphodiesterase [Sesbania bispinosa]
MAPPTDIIAISSDSETDNEEHNEPNTWVASMTKSKCSGKHTLCVPAWIRFLVPHEPEYMFVRYDQEPLQFWELNGTRTLELRYWTRLVRVLQEV